MLIDDFYHMRQGMQLTALAESETALLKSQSFEGNGRKKALLMLHGFSSSPAVYREMFSKVTPHYDAVFCPLLPGHGESIDAFSTVKALEWLRFAEEQCENLLNQYEKVDVLGLSLGGLLSCYLGQRFKLNHLYLLAPALDLHFPIKRTLKLAKFCSSLGFYQVRNAAGNLMNPEQTEIAYRRLPLTTVREILIFIHEFQWQLPACPVDLFLGCHDQVVHSHHVSQFFSKHSQANIHWLKNSAHILPLDMDKELITDVITERNQAN